MSGSWGSGERTERKSDLRAKTSRPQAPRAVPHGEALEVLKKGQGGQKRSTQGGCV